MNVSDNVGAAESSKTSENDEKQWKLAI
jgi:hypothetical protein